MQNRRLSFLGLGGVLAAALFLACSGSSSSDAPKNFVDPGPYVAGVTTLEFADRNAEVWYPVEPGDESGDKDAYYIRDWLPDVIDQLLDPEANPPLVMEAYRDAPASSAGPFPVVVFAHGFAGFRTQSSFLTSHLASWGFVVVAPAYLERGLSSALGIGPESPLEDVMVSRSAVDRLEEASASSGLLAGIADTSTLAIVGHSAGGGSAMRFGLEPDVATYIPMTSGFGGSVEAQLPQIPSLWIGAGIDGVVSIESVENGYAAAATPKRLLVLDNGGHLAPSDLCAIGEEGGGIVKIANDSGFAVPQNLARLGTDGCQEDALPAREGWKVVRHGVTAQIRVTLGIDSDAIGLSSAAFDETFPGIALRYEEDLG